jgi:hypothetical protein
MSSEFDLNKIYSKIYSKEEVIKMIKRAYDEKFMVVILPTDKDKADIILRSVK